MYFSLKDKVAVVTGGGQGIGRAISVLMAEQGAHVAILDLNAETANATKDEIEILGQKALVCQVDVSNFEQVKDAGKKIIDCFGQIDIWVNNAGWDKIEPFISSTKETWDKVIQINLHGVLNGCFTALTYMRERNAGKIINIGSDAGRVGSSGEAVYSAAKGGVIAFTKTLARESARHQININCICPAPTDTPLLNQIVGDNEKIGKALIKAIPLGRIAKPEEIAAAVVFLASDGASFITGQTISVNGGLTMC